ncbi:hypothetical protein SK128_015643 [Halocaridina rubra]|uniref:Uncharacterized protein n=1 Tax=Halocaridina rubra TaxID=373956 RepID=A0AAN9AB16_HALRR
MVITLCLINPTTGNSGINNIPISRNKTRLPGLLHNNMRLSLVNDVIATLNVLITESSASLQILYDQPYVDTVLEITHHYEMFEKGIIVYEYNGTITELNVLMNAATNKTAAVVLGDYSNYLRIFEKVRDHRINSYKVTWLLLLEQEDTENNDEMISELEVLLPEGTPVILLVFSFTEVTRVYSAAVNQKGNIRFQPSGKIQSPNPRLDIHNPNDPEIYTDLKGRHLTVASSSLIPHMVLGKQYEDGSYEVVGGSESFFLEALANALNFT